jgi:hypothetical protein
MEKFTASNGIEIEFTANGYLLGRRNERQQGASGLVTHATAGPEGIVALREFFQAERDAELGRWRTGAHPDIFARPFDSKRIEVYDEANGDQTSFARNDVPSPDAPSGEWPPCVVARAYFAAHPVPRPWENAKPGEIWRLTTSVYGDHIAAVIHTSRGDDKPLMFIPVDDPSIPSLGLRAPIIVTAVRWPEGETTT